VVGLFILAAIAAVVLARDFLMPVAFAFYTAVMFRPLIRRLAFVGVPPWLTAVGFLVVIVTGLLAVVWLFSGVAADWIAHGPELQHEFMRKIRDIGDMLRDVAAVTERLRDAAAPAAEGDVQEVVVRNPVLPDLLMLVANYPLSVAVMAFGALIMTLFLMASGDLFYEKLVRVLPTLSDKKNALRITYDVEREVSRYLVTTALINAGVGLAVGIPFFLLAMPSPHLWALVAFALNFIPYIGPLAGIGVSAMVALVAFDTISDAALVPLAYAAVVAAETHIVTPSVLSRGLSLNAVAVLLAVAFWTWAWGIAGAVLAVPFLVTLRVLCDHLPALSGLGEFLSERSGNGTAN
jgi:predicted PurR-regulated permease PerM